MKDELDRFLGAIGVTKASLSERTDFSQLAYCDMLQVICNNFVRLYASEQIALYRREQLCESVRRWANSTIFILGTVQSTKNYAELGGLLEMAHERGSALLDECLKLELGA